MEVSFNYEELILIGFPNNLYYTVYAWHVLVNYMLLYLFLYIINISCTPYLEFQINSIDLSYPSFS